MKTNITKNALTHNKGNKTLCDYCNSKAVKKARRKEHKEATPTVDAASEHSVDDQSPTTTPPTPSPPPTTTSHANEEGINK